MITLLPLMTSDKQKVKRNLKCPHFNRSSLHYISGAKCVKNFKCGGSPSFGPGLPSSIFWWFSTSLLYLRGGVWPPWQSFYLLLLFTIWGLLECHVSSVCRCIRCICLFDLNGSAYPKASQHCSHNQSRHPTICYITFYFKASFSLNSETSYSLWIKNFQRSQPVTHKIISRTTTQGHA